MLRDALFLAKHLLPNVSLRRSMAALRSILTAVRLPDIPPFPVYLQVEVTTHCNFRCPHCARLRLNMEKRHFCKKQFERLLPQIPALVLVLLQGQGEPFLWPPLFEMVRSARKMGVYTATCTNGSFVSNHVRDIIDSGLNYLAYSVDAVGAEAHRWRPGSDWRLIEAGIAALNSCRQETPMLAVWATLHENALAAFREIFAWGLGGGFTAFNLQPVQSYATLIPETRVAAETTALSKEIKQMTAGRPDILITHTPFRNAPRLSHCRFPWLGSYLDVQGNIRPCCVTFGEEYVMGNIAKESFGNVWRNERYVSFRRQMKSARPPRCCTQCHLF